MNYFVVQTMLSNLHYKRKDVGNISIMENFTIIRRVFSWILFHFQKQSQEKIEVVMEEKQEALRKTEESHHAVIEDIQKQHQQV